MYSIMEQKYETRVRSLALSKGLRLVQIQNHSRNTGEVNLYRLTSGNGATIYPAGLSNDGVPLHEAEDWLAHPWE